MEFFIKFFVFLLGLLVGSFLNCVIYRIEKGESFLRGRSYCPHCRHKLLWLDLIPVLSFLFLRGKCRYCRQKISFQYPLVETSTAILFLLLVFFPISIDGGRTSINFGDLFFYWILVCFLIVIFIFDLKHYIIPDKVIYPAIVVSSIWYLVSGIFFNFYTRYEILNTIYSAFGAALFFGTIVLVSRGRWMGIGDIKLAFLMGLILGWPNILVALFLAFLTGAATGVGLIAANKKTLKSEVPFGPFLVGGTVVALFFGQNIIDWYFNLLLLK